MTEIITLNTKSKVPDHLADSNIFCRYGKNEVVEVTPKELHFAGYKLDQKNVLEIRFTNISDEISRFHIIPPVSKYFKLRYEKPARLVPGFFVKCEVIFTPDKVRNYNDFIKIHTKDTDNNVIVPIYAYPAIEGLQIPRNIKFPVTPIGQKCLKVLQLHSDSDYSFDYEVVVTKDNPCISLDPLTGTIPAHGNQVITLKFEPSDFTTCEKTVNIYVNQYNFKPIICTISGTSEPGLERLLLVNEYQMPEELISINKLEAKGRAMKSKMSLALSQSVKSKSSTILAVQPHDEFKELKTEFESRVRENVNKEKENQLKWQKCVGSVPLSEEEIFSIHQQREQEMHEYKLRMRRQEELKDSYLDSYLNHKSSQRRIHQKQWMDKRTIRTDEDDYERIPVPEADVDAADDKSNKEQLINSECWKLRTKVLERFRGAVSRVIIIRRMEIRLQKLLESGGEFIEKDDSHRHPGSCQLLFHRTPTLQGLDADNTSWNSPVTLVPELDNENWDLSLPEYQVQTPTQPNYEFWSLSVPLMMQVAGYKRVDTSMMSFNELSPIGLKMKTPIIAEKSAVVEDTSNQTNVSIYTANTEAYSFLHKDKNTSLWVLPKSTHTSHEDQITHQLYYWPETNDQDQSLAPIGRSILDWRHDKSNLLVCKKLIKSSTSDRLILQPYINSIVQQAEVPKQMLESDMEKLDYLPTVKEDSKDPIESGIINLSLITEEFPIISAIRSDLDKELE